MRPTSSMRLLLALAAAVAVVVVQPAGARECRNGEPPACDVCACFDDARRVVCTNLRLQELPCNLPTSTAELLLDRNDIESVDPGDLPPNLTHLNLGRNRIAHFNASRWAQDAPKSLAHLNLANNIIRSVSPRRLQHERPRNAPALVPTPELVNINMDDNPLQCKPTTPAAEADVDTTTTTSTTTTVATAGDNSTGLACDCSDGYELVHEGEGDEGADAGETLDSTSSCIEAVREPTTEDDGRPDVRDPWDDPVARDGFIDVDARDGAETTMEPTSEVGLAETLVDAPLSEGDATTEEENDVLVTGSVSDTLRPSTQLDHPPTSSGSGDLGGESENTTTASDKPTTATSQTTSAPSPTTTTTREGGIDFGEDVDFESENGASSGKGSATSSAWFAGVMSAGVILAVVGLVLCFVVARRRTVNHGALGMANLHVENVGRRTSKTWKSQGQGQTVPVHAYEEIEGAENSFRPFEFVNKMAVAQVLSGIDVDPESTVVDVHQERRDEVLRRTRSSQQPPRAKVVWIRSSLTLDGAMSMDPEYETIDPERPIASCGQAPTLMSSQPPALPPSRQAAAAASLVASPGLGHVYARLDSSNSAGSAPSPTNLEYARLSRKASATGEYLDCEDSEEPSDLSHAVTLPIKMRKNPLYVDSADLMQPVCPVPLPAGAQASVGAPVIVPSSHPFAVADSGHAYTLVVPEDMADQEHYVYRFYSSIAAGNHAVKVQKQGEAPSPVRASQRAENSEIYELWSPERSVHAQHAGAAPAYAAAYESLQEQIPRDEQQRIELQQRRASTVSSMEGGGYVNHFALAQMRGSVGYADSDGGHQQAKRLSQHSLLRATEVPYSQSHSAFDGASPEPSDTDSFLEAVDAMLTSGDALGAVDDFCETEALEVIGMPGATGSLGSHGSATGVMPRFSGVFKRDPLLTGRRSASADKQIPPFVPSIATRSTGSPKSQTAQSSSSAASSMLQRPSNSATARSAQYFYSAIQK